MGLDQSSTSHLNICGVLVFTTSCGRSLDAGCVLPQWADCLRLAGHRLQPFDKLFAEADRLWIRLVAGHLWIDEFSPEKLIGCETAQQFGFLGREFNVNGGHLFLFTL